MAAGEAVYGTSAPARFWLVVEQNGPWGRSAATQSYLPHDLGEELTRRCRTAGGRLLLMRRPGIHAEPRSGPRRCYVAWSGAGAWLLFGRVEEPDDLLHLPFASLEEGDRSAVLAALPQFREVDPVLLVCTNGRHDVCCAIRGRPVAVATGERFQGRVWECSHTGGHRFSPTGVLLPWGRALARMNERTATDVLVHAERGRLPVEMLGPWHDRGASALAPQLQVGESSVRALIGESDLEALAAFSRGPREVGVAHRDGRQWLVHLSVMEGGRRRNSCGEPEEPARTWKAAVRQIRPA